MNLIYAAITLAQNDDFAVSRMMGKVVAGIVIAIVVLVIIKKIKKK